jgi:hypothetical protein
MVMTMGQQRCRGALRGMGTEGSAGIAPEQVWERFAEIRAIMNRGSDVTSTQRHASESQNGMNGQAGVGIS